MRKNNRPLDQLRSITIEPNYLKNPLGSTLISMGDTKVLCTTSIEDRIPPFLKDTGKGWLTAEYSLLPGSTTQRSQREAAKGKQSGRTLEIQRLIGRSLRSCVDLTTFGERTIFIDCDVIQADAGTRTAAITGAFVSLYQALKTIVREPKDVLTTQVAAISVGYLNNNVYLDLNYEEDSGCDVDLNLVMNSKNDVIEIQGTAERKGMSMHILSTMIETANKGINELFHHQLNAIELLK